AASARGGDALGRRRVRDHRAVHRHIRRRRAAGWTIGDLSGRLGLSRRRRRHGRGHRAALELDADRLQPRAGLGSPVHGRRLRPVARARRAAVSDRPGPARSCRREGTVQARGRGMMALLVNVFLWAVVAALALAGAVKSGALFTTGLRSGARDFVYLLPRVTVGIIGSGYIAAVLPPSLIAGSPGPPARILRPPLPPLA